jgi:hypothetical protein
VSIFVEIIEIVLDTTGPIHNNKSHLKHFELKRFMQQKLPQQQQQPIFNN